MSRYWYMGRRARHNMLVGMIHLSPMAKLAMPCETCYAGIYGPPGQGIKIRAGGVEPHPTMNLTLR